jgi:hypothetical protein
MRTLFLSVVCGLLAMFEAYASPLQHYPLTKLIIEEGSYYCTEPELIRKTLDMKLWSRETGFPIAPIEGCGYTKDALDVFIAFAESYENEFIRADIIVVYVVIMIGPTEAIPVTRLYAIGVEKEKVIG